MTDADLAAYDPSNGTYSALFTPPNTGGGPYVFGATIYRQAVASTSAPVALVPTAALSTLSLSANGIALAGPSPTSTPVTLQVKDQFGDTLDATGLTALFSANSSQVSFQGAFALASTTVAVTGSPAGLLPGQTLTGQGIAAGSTITSVDASGGATFLQISTPTTAATIIGFNARFAKGSRSIVVVGNATGLAAGVPISGPGIASGTTIESTSLTGTGDAQLEFEVNVTQGNPVSLTLLVNGGSGVGGTTISFKDNSPTAITGTWNIGISGTLGTMFGNFSGR